MSIIWPWCGSLVERSPITPQLVNASYTNDLARSVTRWVVIAICAVVYSAKCIRDCQNNIDPMIEKFSSLRGNCSVGFRSSLPL